MQKLPKNFPPDWGGDSLSDFIDAANQNTFGVFVRYKDWFTLLRRIDEVFDEFATNLIDAPEFLGAFLFIRAHSSFRGAVRLSMSGQLPEAYSLLRGCLKYALYSFYIHKHPALAKLWLGRDASQTSKQKFRNRFVVGKMLDELNVDDPVTGKIARELYERTIDAGAHPNPKTITLAMKRKQTNDVLTFTLSQLNVEHQPLLVSLKTAVQVGLCSLKIFRLVFRIRFDLLGLSVEIDRLSRVRIQGIAL